MVISITDDGSESHGYHLQIAWLRWTGSRRSIGLYPKQKWKMLTNYWKFPNRNVQTFRFVYHHTNGLNHGPVWKTQLFFLNGICTVILWQDWFGTRQLERILLKYGWEKVFHLGMDNHNRELAGKKLNINPMWKVPNKEVDLVEPTSFLWSCILGLHSKTIPNKQRYCGQLQNHVRITNFRGDEQKNFHSLKIFVFLHGLMTWRVMQRNVWSDIVS